MRVQGEFESLHRNLHGDLVVSFVVSDSIMDKIETMKGHPLTLEITKFFEKRSLDANRYFWKLCEGLAIALGSTKDDIYKLQLSKYGIFQDLYVKASAVEYLRRSYRYIEEFEHRFTIYDEEMAQIRCYIGSSTYDRKEMARLIDGTVQDCNELGVETWTPEEIERLVNRWEAK